MACPFFLATVRMPVYKFSSRSLSVNYLVSAPLFFRHPTDFSSWFFFFLYIVPLSPFLSLSLSVVLAEARAGDRRSDGVEENRRHCRRRTSARCSNPHRLLCAWTHFSSQVPEGAIAAIYNQLHSLYSLIAIDFPICTVGEV